MSLTYKETRLLRFLFVFFLIGSAHAQWKLLHPGILPFREGHFIDASTVRTYHGQNLRYWARRAILSGLSTDGGMTWSYHTLSIPPPSMAFTYTSFYSAYGGYCLGAASSDPYEASQILYHTSDGGETWRKHASHDVGFLDWSFHSAREGIIAYFRPSRDDICMSRDSGRTFQQIGDSRGAPVLAFSDGGPYLYLRDSVAMISVDGGLSFHPNACPVSGVKTTTLRSDGRVWVLWGQRDASYKRMSYSSDHGRTWVTFADSLAFEKGDMLWRMVFRDSTHGIGMSRNEFWYTSDGGRSWKTTASFIRSTGTKQTLHFEMICDTTSGHLLLMDGDAGDDYEIRDGPIRYRRSTDFGQTWTMLPSAVPWTVRDVKRWSDRNMVAVSLPASLYTPWDTPFDSVAVLVARDDGATWTEAKLMSGPHQDHLTVFPHGGVLLGSSLYSEDYGQTWLRSERPPGLHSTAIPLFLSDGVGITAAQSDSLHVVILQSEDRGKSWHSIARVALPFPGRGYPMRIMNLPSGTWHLTFKYLEPYDRQSVYRILSADQGKSWGSFQRITSATCERDILEPRTVDGQHYLHAQDGYGAWELYRSSDSGKTYIKTVLTMRYPPSPNAYFPWAGFDYGWLAPDLCYAVSLQGYCLSRDGGITWTPEEGHLLDGIRRLVIGDSLEKWFVGLYGVILQHRGSLGVVTSTDSPSPTPRDFSLPVTYPNPASSSSTAQVEFTLERDMPVGVFVYDLLGRRQRVIHEGRLPAGPQRFTLRTAGLPPGLYFVAVSTPEGVRVGKVVVRK